MNYIKREPFRSPVEHAFTRATTMLDARRPHTGGEHAQNPDDRVDTKPNLPKPTPAHDAPHFAHKSHCPTSPYCPRLAMARLTHSE